MDINDLTIAQAREIAALFSANQTIADIPHPLVGKYVVCRFRGAGVHAGLLISSIPDGTTVLKDSRRLWSWVGNQGIALSGVSQYGIKSGKLDVVVPLAAMTECVEMLVCSNLARASINDY